MIQDRICKQCSSCFRGGPRAYYCLTCRVERTKIANRECKERKKKGMVRQIGSTGICEKCGKKYIVNSGIQRFCPDCQKEHTLEYDRLTGLKYYHIYKNKINPTRNLRRQIGAKKCYWCGKEFVSHNKKMTCSLECSNKRKNHLWNICKNSNGKLK